MLRICVSREARKLIAPLLSQTYAQAAESITVNNSAQTDETITKIVCPPLKLLQPASLLSKQNISTSIPQFPHRLQLKLA
ncbi:hypothetical protein TNCV_2977981 [Trichonephila clavipes]|nr:hypothetical protein TNCV_2977981 [Trichonephila clavipes]